MRSPPNVVGYCDVVGPKAIEGWACDRSKPGAPLALTLFIDGVPIGPVTCSLRRPDVAAAGLAPERVGFFAEIPSGFQDGNDHVIELRLSSGARIALEDPSGLRSAWPLIDPKRGPGNGTRAITLAARLDEVREHQAQGWAYDRAAPDRPVTLDILVDGALEGAIVCDIERPDVTLSGQPTAKVGFVADLPARCLDGENHVLEIHPHAANAAFEAGTPPELLRRTFCSSPQAVVSHIDGLRDGAVRGWLFLHDRKSGSKRGGLQVLVMMQNHPVAQLTAAESRPDVAAAHGCEPNCGFAFFPPPELVAGRVVEFHFTIVPGGVPLSGSPLRVDFPSLETIGVLRELHEASDKLFTELWLLRDRLRRTIASYSYNIANYDLWTRQYQQALAAAPDQLTGLIRANGSPPPLVSIICPVYRPRLTDFVAAVESVRAQTYENWELIVVDDASRSAELTACIRSFTRQDRRIRALSLPRNRGISAATNAAVAQAIGAYVAFFDHDDLLAHRAVEFMLAAALRTGAQLLYSDEDKIDDDGVFSDVNLKPDWNYRLLLAQNYVCHLLMVERAQLVKAGLFRKPCDGAQDHDMVLRLSELIPHHRIVHVPEVLYHWRKTPMSTAGSPESKIYAVAAGARAIQDHLNRKGLPGRVHSPRRTTASFEIEWDLTRRSPPTVTIVIPYREQIGMTRECLEALRSNTDYPDYRIVLVDNWSTSDEALLFADEMRESLDVTVMRVEEPYNFARINNLAVAVCSSELILFMNNDVFVSQPEWLSTMVGEMLADPRVAIVGNKLFYPDRLVQHGGVILGVGGVADHAHKWLEADDPGYFARAICAQDMSAVTAACMLCRRSVFNAVGGFDEENLKVAFNDIDLCLKIAAAGFRIVWTPSSKAEHRESASRGSDFRPDQQARFFHEHETMMRRWPEAIANDRFYHRAFSRRSGIFRELGPPSVAQTAGVPAHSVKRSGSAAPRLSANGVSAVDGAAAPAGGVIADAPDAAELLSVAGMDC